MARTRAQTTMQPATPAADSGSVSVSSSPAANDVPPESPLPPGAAPAGQADATHAVDEPAQQQQQAGTGSETENDRDERIRRAAYRRFEARAGSHGDPVQDWLDAEAEVDSTGPGR